MAYIRCDTKLRAVGVLPLAPPLLSGSARQPTYYHYKMQKSFETLIDILDNYSLDSGLKLNIKKCNI